MSASETRLCVVCGREFDADMFKRGDTPCGAEDEFAPCTLDMTYREAWEHWRKLAHDRHAEVKALRKENERLRLALASVIAACDQGRMVPRPGSGVCGMTVEANIRSSIYTGVPAWPVEEARAALQGETGE